MSASANTDVLDRAGIAVEGTFRRVRRHVLATASWSRRQSWKRLGWFLGLAAAATLAALVLLRGLYGVVAGLWDLAFVADPPKPVEPDAPPQWAVDLGQSPFWTALGDNLTGYLHQQATATGLPVGILPTAWMILGGLLLIFAWMPLRHRIPSLMAWWAWLAATCWQLYTLTPGHSPLPALLAAGAGVLLSLSPAIWFFASPIVVFVGVLIL